MLLGLTGGGMAATHRGGQVHTGQHLTSPVASEAAMRHTRTRHLAKSEGSQKQPQEPRPTRAPATKSSTFKLSVKRFGRVFGLHGDRHTNTNVL